MKSGTIFDNILVTDSVDEAKEHAKETFEVLREEEKEQKEKADEEERKRIEEEEKKRKEVSTVSQFMPAILSLQSI